MTTVDPPIQVPASFTSTLSQAIAAFRGEWTLPPIVQLTHRPLRKLVQALLAAESSANINDGAIHLKPSEENGNSVSPLPEVPTG